MRQQCDTNTCTYRQILGAYLFSSGMFIIMLFRSKQFGLFTFKFIYWLEIDNIIIAYGLVWHRMVLIINCIWHVDALNSKYMTSHRKKNLAVFEMKSTFYWSCGRNFRTSLGRLFRMPATAKWFNLNILRSFIGLDAVNRHFMSFCLCISITHLRDSFCVCYLSEKLSFISIQWIAR